MKVIEILQKKNLTKLSFHVIDLHFGRWAWLLPDYVEEC